jgi:hypothetical protein
MGKVFRLRGLFLMVFGKFSSSWIQACLDNIFRNQPVYSGAALG